ncbi:inorganic triphosphatase [Entomohabitans teleogrylli]|uniref:CYTH domain-containing protein n=1 Tax=Entomohabitans teleogrylli TaxID=1384589 RepID=UPI00073D74CF|nr:inorganic triphosphatase [Entomohabitans teleogrylli]
MAQEIELKFIVEQTALEPLRAALDALTADHTAPRQLLNIYYETPDLLLRRHDMGLRIRGDNGRYEMTMKTAGRTTGGLHQRPEYNVELATPELQLALFPADMWPQGLEAQALALRVEPLFSTDFLREKWVVTYGDSRIEIALDLGEVKSGADAEPICELELELLEGATGDLLKLARQLVAVPGLRQGSLSKAARGYHLAQGNPTRPIKPLGVLRVAAKSSIEQALAGALEMALAHWQYHEELWVRGNESARGEVAAGMALVRHALALFGGIVPRKASAHLRDQLTRCEASLVSGESAMTLAFSPLFSGARLALTEWIIGAGWQPFLDDKARRRIADSFKRFADNQLSRHAAEQRRAFELPIGANYQERLPRLVREIDAVRLLAGAYQESLALPWLERWQQLHDAMAHGQRAEVEELRRQALAQPPFWRHSGKA